MKQVDQVIERLKALRQSEKLPEHTLERVVIESCISDLEAVTEHISNLEGLLEGANKRVAILEEAIDDIERFIS